METIDFKLQDTIFNKLIKRNKFNNWKKDWSVYVRDFKPSWVYELAEKITKIELNDKSKPFYKRNPKFSHRPLPKSSLYSERSVNSNEFSNNFREKIVKKKLPPILENEFKSDIKKTGGV